MTQYVILNSQNGAWHEVGRHQASSPRRALTALGVDEGTYVAVPARSWKPLTVKVERTTRLTIK